MPLIASFNTLTAATLSREPGLLYGVLFWVFVLGAALGSFLNVVGLRLLREETFMKGGSYCFSCKQPIRPWDNIPLVSWLVLMGKCRHCKAPISIQYPVVEALTGLLLASLVYTHGLGWQTLLLAWLILNSIVVLITDLREQYIFDINSLGLIPVGLLYAFLVGALDPAVPKVFELGVLIVPAPFLSSVLAVFGSFVVFFILNTISRLLFGTVGFGEGDVRLLMGFGAYFGLKWMLFIFVAGFIVQAALGIPVLLWGWGRQKAWRVMGLTVGAFVCATGPYALQLLWPDTVWLLILSLVLGLAALVLGFLGLREAKTLPGGLTYLPFGPALVVAAWLVVFVSPVLVELLPMLSA
ncbi:MAG: prepilin peptidase [Cyanobacteria bacterium HKST-UBA04]|nr:prepilin peptidase [Cyanobacteria bacterium HKST-UBA04]